MYAGDEFYDDEVTSRLDPPDIRFYPCGHSTLDHATPEDCDRYRADLKAERDRQDRFGLCASCDLGLPYGCNHP